MSIRISCDTEPKRANRELILNYLRTHIAPSKRKKIKVLCLPGHEGLEVYEIWDKLGVLRKNIYAVTNDSEEHKKIKGIRGINVIFGDVFEYNGHCHRALLNITHSDIDGNTKRYFDVIYLDLYGPADGHIVNLSRLSWLVKNNGFLGCTFLNRREKTSYARRMKLAGDAHYIDSFAEKLMRLMTFVMALPDYKVKDERFKPFNEIRAIPDKEDIFYWTKKGFEPIDAQNKKLARKHLSENGVYPLDILKTKYLGGKSSPMGTVIIKIRKISLLPTINFWKIIAKSFSVLNNDIIFINGCHDVSTKRRKLNIGSYMRQDRTVYVRKKTEDRKKQVLEYLKVFDKKEDLTEISRCFGFTVNQLRAFKAHITMGTYDQA